MNTCWKFITCFWRSPYWFAITWECHTRQMYPSIVRFCSWNTEFLPLEDTFLFHHIAVVSYWFLSWRYLNRILVFLGQADAQGKMPPLTHIFSLKLARLWGKTHNLLVKLMFKCFMTCNSRMSTCSIITNPSKVYPTLKTGHCKWINSVINIGNLPRQSFEKSCTCIGSWVQSCKANRDLTFVWIKTEGNYCLATYYLLWYLKFNYLYFECKLQ